VNGFFQRTFAALSIREFRILWLGTLAAFVAFFMATVVQADVAFRLTGQNSAVGLVVFGQGLAMFFLNPVGGTLADVFPRKLIVAACQVVIFAVFVILSILVATGVIEVLMLAAGSFVIGSSFSFLGPARNSWVIDLVDMRRRPNAVALNQVALNMAQVVGPSLAGVAISIAFIRAEGAYAFMAALYLFAIIVTITLPGTRPSAARSRSVLGDLVAGLRYVRGQPRLMALVIFFVMVLVAGFPYVTVTRGLVENEFGRGSGSFGALATAAASGALLSSLAVAQLADSPRVLAYYLGLGTVFGIGLIGVGAAPTFAGALGAMFLLGCGTGGFQALNSAVILRECAPSFYGRVLSLTMLAFAGSNLMGLPLGIVADAIGERLTLAMMGGAVCAIIAAFAVILPRTRPSDTHDEPPTSAGLPATGQREPAVVTVTGEPAYQPVSGE
jgi:predicted MFS family arabinose efflux permease